MRLEDIESNVGLENDRLECKGKLNRDDILSWLKTIAGFANASGGDFYIGVEDKTNKLIGFSREEADKERNFFNNQVNEHLSPRPAVKLSFLRYDIRGEERFVIRAKVAEADAKPVILTYKGVPSIYMRREGYTNGATYEEIRNMVLETQPVQYDMLVTEEKYKASDFTELRRFYSDHNDGRTLTDKALLSMGFFNQEGFLSKGALLFADGYEGPETAAQASVFSGFNKGSDRVVTLNRFKGNLISIISQLMEFVLSRMNHSFIKLGQGRKNLDAYPERAVFEGVINAVAHRDYFLDGTQIQLDMFRDRLEISSPGSFYMGGKLGKTYDLSGIISMRRNKLITSVLVSCNVMEAAGTGFDKILNEYASADDSHRPYLCSTSEHFTLVLPDLTYQAGYQELPQLSFFPAADGTKYDEAVLSFCYGAERKVADIAAHLGISDSSYLRKQILGNLEKQGYLVRSRLGNAACYRTNPDEVEIL